MTTSRILAAAAAGALLLAGGYALGQAKTGGDTVKPIFSQKLKTMPGKSMTAITVDYAPGGASGSHRHADSAEIFAYVVEGSVRSKVNDGPETVYTAGQFWYEPPGAHHGVSANASTTKPARILAVIVANDGATLTTFDK